MDTFTPNIMESLKIALFGFWGEFTDLNGTRFADLHRTTLNPFGSVYFDGEAEIRTGQNNFAPAPFPLITCEVPMRSFGDRTLTHGNVYSRITGNRHNKQLIYHVMSQFAGRFKGGAISPTLEIPGYGIIALHFAGANEMPQDPANLQARDITQGLMQMWIMDFTV